jgi:hypothetical protein
VWHNNEEQPMFRWLKRLFRREPEPVQIEDLIAKTLADLGPMKFTDISSTLIEHENYKRRLASQRAAFNETIRKLEER